MPPLARVEILDQKIAMVTGGFSDFNTQVEMCRSVPGGRFDKSNKLWKYPLDYKVCLEIRKSTRHYGCKLEIGPELREWAKIEKERLDAIPKPTDMELVDLPRLRENYPTLWKAVESRPFQTVGIGFMSGVRNAVAVLADDPGLGKTLQTIGAVANKFDEALILVIAPKSAASVVWPEEIERWLPGDKVVNLSQIASVPKARRQTYLDEQFSIVENAPGRVWVITGEHWVKVRTEKDSRKEFKRDADGRVISHPNLPELFEFVWDAVIVDESHKTVICNTAKRSRHTQSRYGLDELALSEGSMKIALSGTPMRGKAENMWGTLNWLKPEYYTSYWKWMDKNFEAFDNTDDPFGPDKVFGQLKDKKEFYDSMKDMFLRRTKGEVASDLPPKMYAGEPLDGDGPVAVWLEMTAGQKRQYKQMERDGETEEGIIGNGVLSEWTRLKQFAGSTCKIDGGEILPTGDSNKLEWVKEFLDDRGLLDGSGNGKVIIASQFSKMIDMFEAQLGIPTFKLTGGTSASRRVEIADKFQNDPNSPKIFLLTTTAGGVALTLDAADDVIMLDETWIPDDQTQVEDRAHRISRPDHNVTIWNLRSKGSIEESIARITMGREGETLGIMDESRGIKLIKKIKELEVKK